MYKRFLPPSGGSSAPPPAQAEAAARAETAKFLASAKMAAAAQADMTEDEALALLADDEARAKADAACELPEGSTWHEYGGKDLELLFAHTSVINVEWLVKLAEGEVMPERKGVVPAWQELPPEAKVSLEQLRQAKGGYGLPLAILSCTPLPRLRPPPQAASALPDILLKCFGRRLGGQGSPGPDGDAAAAAAARPQVHAQVRQDAQWPDLGARVGAPPQHPPPTRTALASLAKLWQHRQQAGRAVAPARLL